MPGSIPIAVQFCDEQFSQPQIQILSHVHGLCKTLLSGLRSLPPPPPFLSFRHLCRRRRWCPPCTQATPGDHWFRGGCRRPSDALDCRFMCFFIPHATDLALFAEGYFSLNVCGPFWWHFLTKNIHFSLESVCSRGMAVQLAAGCQTPLPEKSLNQGTPVSTSCRVFFWWRLGGLL